MAAKPGPAGLAGLREHIRAISDFPKKGVLFRDITPLLAHGKSFRNCIQRFKRLLAGPIDCVISIESRGFILGSALACELGVGFVPIRKQGKLPSKTHRASYKLEYGRAVMEVHTDALKRGARVIIVDDVLATGGTAKAALDLAKKFDAKIVGILFLIELAALGGRKKLKGYPVHSLVSY
jgi:adenine phosphoribosyltransferase